MYPLLKDNIKLIIQPIGGTIADLWGDKVETVNPTGAELLKLCDGKNTIDEISKKMAKRHNERVEQVKNLVIKFLNESQEKGHVSIYKDRPPKSRVKGMVVGSTNYYTPMHAMLELTYNCNLRCKHCYATERKTDSRDISTQEWKIILDKLKKAGVLMVTLTGGEATTRRDFFEILDYCKGKFNIVLMTNGYRIDEEFAERLSRYPVFIQISLDGPNSKTHDYIRGVKGSFEKATRAISILSKKGKSVTVAMMVTPFNIDQIEETAELTKKLGAKGFRVGRVLPIGRAKNLKWGLNKDEIQQMNRITDYLQKKHQKELSVSPWSVITGKKRELPKYRKNCGAGTIQFAVSPTGWVRPCAIMDEKYSIGNLLTQDIREIFRSRKINLFADIPAPQKDICKDCDYLNILCRGCIGIASAMYEQNKDCAMADMFKKILEVKV